MRIFPLAALFAFAPVLALGNGTYQDPGLVVNRVSATQFEVIEGRGKGPRGMWCAAALHSINSLGITRGRIYIAEPRGPSRTVRGRKGVVFSTTAVGNAPSSPSISVRTVGANYPVNHALQFCRDYDLIFEF